MSYSLASAPRQSVVVPRPQAFWRQLSWLTCMSALLSLSLGQFIYKFVSFGGTLASVVFISSWVVFALQRPDRTVRDLVSGGICWLIPALALASIVWSDDPGYTMRTAMELCMSVAGAVICARRVPARGFVAAVMLALFAAVFVSLVAGSHVGVGGTDEEALSGAFGSKNYMGQIAAIYGLASLCVLLDRGQPVLFRLIAMIGSILGPFLVVRSISVDAVAGYAIGFALVAGLMTLSVIPRRLRAPTVLATLLIAAVMIAWLWTMILQDQGFALSALGKDPTLTGRTYLWYRANALIGQNPLLGVGYQAFWRQGNLEAEGLWRVMHVMERMGFHFHNLYYETTVELGVLGLIALVVTLLTGLIASLRLALRSPAGPTAFLAAYVVFVIVRSPLEVEYIFPFDIATFLFAACLAYVTGPAARYRAVTRTPIGQRVGLLDGLPAE
jgi:exopolysaccharide production protein ExoQ